MLFLSVLPPPQQPKIEDVLKGPNTTFADVKRNWEPIAKAIDSILEKARPKTFDDIWRAMSESDLRSNSTVSFGTQMIEVKGAAKGTIIMMAVTDRANPEKLSRSAGYLFTRKGERVIHSFLGNGTKLPDGGIYSGTAVRYGEVIVVGGSNGRMVGEGGYGPGAAVVLRRTGAEWRQILAQEFNKSGIVDVSETKGFPKVSLRSFSNHSPTVKSQYLTPTFITEAELRFMGRRFVARPEKPVHNAYWTVSQFVSALQKNDLKEARKYVQDEHLVQEALDAGAAKGGVWQATEGSGGGISDLQLNQVFADRSWFSFSLGFDKFGELDSKIVKVTSYAKGKKLPGS